MRFLGVRDVLPELLGPARVFCLASSEESFGLSALEAMACGTAVVSTDVGGVREVVNHGKSGFLAEPEDLDGYAEALGTLLSQPALAEEMGRTARREAEERFDRDHVIGRYEDLYRSVLGA